MPKKKTRPDVNKRWWFQPAWELFQKLLLTLLSKKK
jgi:hypothetical protein